MKHNLFHMNEKKLNLNCDHLKTSNSSADNFKMILDLDGFTPEPTIRSGDTGQRIPCFVSPGPSVSSNTSCSEGGAKSSRKRPQKSTKTFVDNKREKLYKKRTQEGKQDILLQDLQRQLELQQAIIILC